METAAAERSSSVDRQQTQTLDAPTPDLASTAAAVQPPRNDVVLSQQPSTAQPQIQGLGQPPAYTGPLPSPLQVMWHVPSGLSDAFHVSDQNIRGWVDDAANYHGVPTELFAAVLQNENNPNASTLNQVLQFGERSLTTFSDILDRATGGLVPDFASAGSSGIANMSRNAVRSGANYVENTLGRAVIPDNVASRVLGWRQDTRISGDDLRSDLYYGAAHLRELIDRVTGVTNYGGPLSRQQVHDIAAAYNGSGPAASRYGDAAVRHIERAVAGERPLYFYQPR